MLSAKVLLPVYLALLMAVLLAAAAAPGWAAETSPSLERVEHLEKYGWIWAEETVTSAGITPARYHPDNGYSASALSETLGLKMEYLLLRDDPVGFAAELQILQEHFMTPTGLIHWQIPIDAPAGNAGSNALVDDLRILNALLQAAEQWPELRLPLMDTAATAAEAMEKRQFTADVFLAEAVTFQKGLFFWNYERVQETLPSAYLHAPAIAAIARQADVLALNHSRWQKVSLTMHGLLFAAVSAPRIPTRWNFQTHDFEFDPGVNMIEYLLPLLYCLELDLLPQKHYDHLHSLVFTGTLGGRYQVEGGQWLVQEKVRSPAVYGLTLLAAIEAEDHEMAAAAFAGLESTVYPLGPERIAFGFITADEPFHLFDTYIILQALRRYSNFLQ